MIVKTYCTQNDNDCKTCNLVSFGHDCHLFELDLSPEEHEKAWSKRLATIAALEARQQKEAEIEKICEELKKLRTEAEIAGYLGSLRVEKATAIAIAEQLFGKEFMRRKRTYTLKRLIESIAGTLIFTQISGTKF